FGLVDMQGQRAQHAGAELVQRLVQAVAAAFEIRHFARPDIRRHHVGEFRVARNLAADVPELLQVGVLAVLGGFHLERRVAARAAAAGHVVLHLGFGGEREETLEHVVGAVDQLARNAVAADAAETEFAVGGADLGNERIAVAVVTADIQGGNMLHGCNPFKGRAVGSSATARAGHVGPIHGDPLQVHERSAADFTIPASFSANCRTSAASAPSTVTRTSGSVPEARNTTRPRPCRVCSTSARAWRTSSPCRASRAPSARTLSITCGSFFNPRRAAARSWPPCASASSTASAAMMPSPVLARSRHRIWPEVSPPSMPWCWRNCCITERSPTLARIRCTSNSASACCSP